MKLAIIIVATPDFLEKWNFCVESQKRYAKKHGIEHLVYTQPIDGLHPKWSKLRYASKALDDYDGIMLIDADARFSAKAPSFGSLFIEHSAADILFVNGVSGRLNSGVMLFRGGRSIASTYLETCIERRNVPVAPENFVTSEGENGHLIENLKEERFAGSAHVLPMTWNCTHPNCYQSANIQHFTGPLRQALYGGMLNPPPSGFVLASDFASRFKRMIRRLGRTKT